MCNYCGTDKYRKIYENHHGIIPIDELGRTSEIHHIDGNHSNNHPENLRAVTLQEHYDIHYSQKDYYACYLMVIQRMDKSSEELSELATLSNNKRASLGTHPFQTEKYRKYQSDKNKKMWEELGENHPACVETRRRVNNGTHHLQVSGADHPDYDDTLYCFENILTGERVTMTQNQLWKKYELHAGAVSDMVNKNRNVYSVKGWALVDSTTGIVNLYQSSNKDTTTYQFKHKLSGKIVSMTREQFCSEFSVRGISELINGIRKSVKGWTIIKNISLTS
jgi:hypothetical protein